MKTYPLFSRTLAVIFLLTCLNLFAKNNDVASKDTLTSYVVIGAFSKQQNAIRFVSHVTGEMHLSAKFDINPNRNLYYVYCLTTADVEQAVTEAKRLRSNSEFADAWVYRGVLGKGNYHASNHDINPITHQVMEVQSAEATQSNQLTAQTNNTLQKASSFESEKPKTAENDILGSEIAINESTGKVEAINNAQPVSNETSVNTKSFIFRIARFVDQAEVKGDIDVIDTDKVKKIATYQGNIPVAIAEPENKTGNLSFVAEVFGYRKMQRDINYFNPLSDSSGITKDEAGNIVLPFELVRLKKGDFAIMYNVYFFRDAAIMRPESRFEVNSLVDMLKENPKYKIKIHGHTNGNHAGRIIYRNEKSKEFFAMTGSRDGFGSAKELSRVRAEEIREYLIEQGIDPERTAVKAWGGKKGIHDKLSARALENVRVEIEILEDK